MKIENKLNITNWENYQTIMTYKGQTKTDTDKTDKTKQENVSYDMSSFFLFFFKTENQKILRY